MTNIQMGLSLNEKGGILGACYTSQEPLFNFFHKAKNLKKSHGVFLKSRNCGRISVLLKGEESNGGIIEKEFEFKPSFDEYLKVMENVKSSREKRKQVTSPSIRDENPMLVVKDKEGGRNMGYEEEGNVRNRVDVEVKRKLGNEKENGRWTNNREVERYDRFEGGRYGDKKMDHFQGEKKNVNRGRSSIREVQRYSEFEGERFRDNEGYRARGRDDFQGERTYGNRGLQNSKRGGAGKLSYEDSSEDDMGMDRAAFKPLEKYNDVYAQPRVSRLDMEERIQTLAKW